MRRIKLFLVEVMRLTTEHRNLVHSADPDEIDHLESYLNQQIPPLGDEKKTETSL